MRTLLANYPKSQILVWLVISFIFIGCKHNGVSGQSQKAIEISWEVLNNGHQSNIIEPQKRVVNSAEELDEIMGSINSTRIPPINIPEVDFNDETVVFLNMGQKSSGGYSIEIDRIEKTNTNVTIYLKQIGPKPGDMVTTVITGPYVLAKFKKQDVPIVFQ